MAFITFTYEMGRFVWFGARKWVSFSSENGWYEKCNTFNVYTKLSRFYDNVTNYNPKIATGPD